MPPPVASLDDAEGTAALVPAGNAAPASALPDIAIARPALHDEVTARLRDLIVENRIQPGERVPELEIAARLGVSRTPIREALKVLAAEGLVEMQPLRGAIVRGFSAKDAQDMLRVIALLEEFAGREACGAPAADIAAVQALHERMREHHRRRERQPYFALNQQIHQAIVALARNETLSAMHAQHPLRGQQRARELGRRDGRARGHDAGAGRARRRRDGRGNARPPAEHLAAHRAGRAARRSGGRRLLTLIRARGSHAVRAEPVQALHLPA
jgi:DNA-binding GntR family transcriptional regulator